MPVIVTISGLDGSGKSTQIELLKKHLESRGKSFWYFHAVEFSVGKLWKLSFHNGSLASKESVTKANWLQIQLRKFALLIDILRFKRMIRKLKVDYIISDRYFFDSVVNINYLDFRSPKFGNPVSKLFAERFIPKPDFAFYIKISPEKIMQRECKPDQGIEYLKAKEKLYQSKIKDWEFIAVDGGREKEEIFNGIKSKVWGEIS